jgi:hypothetical protein
VNVTFRVNMGAVETAAGGVFLSASYNGFGLQAMQHIGNGIYTITVTTTQNSDITYRFVNGPSIGNAELVPLACGLQVAGVYYRTLNTGTEDQALPVVCFGACEDCSFSTLTLRVNMSLETTSAEGVFVEGNFPGLTADVQPMISVGGGVWQFNASLPADYLFRYRFLNGGPASPESINPGCAAADGFREWITTSMPTALDVVCFGECDNCIIVEPVFVNITVQVNMSQQTLSPEGVFIIGSFQDFVPGVAGMSDEGNGIYSYTFVGQQGVEYLYRFCNGASIESSESVPEECALLDENANAFRTVFAGESDQTIDTVCFGACTDCVLEVFRSITFRVNMEEEVNVSNVYVVGNFQGWQLGASEMIDTGSGVFEFNASVTEGQLLQYRFVNGNNWNEAETIPATCGVDDGTGTLQRQWLVAQDAVLNTVCFGDCENCDGMGVEDESEWIVEVYPNPGNDGFFLDNIGGFPYEIKVVDMSGRTVYAVDQLFGKIYVDTASWIKGVYAVSMSTGRKVKVSKWVKM